MCGIAGLISSNSSDEQRCLSVEQMCEAMLHRGPDDQGLINRGPATLGMRRLAIIDPAGGHQPMTSACGRYHLVFNGCIYNHAELRLELSAGGYPFRSKCDTEVLLAAFARWGEECLGRLRGMFAFAVWDDEGQSLFLARDAFGIKPLYYRHDSVNGRFVFASELNALLVSGVTMGEIDPHSVADYLAFFTVPTPARFTRACSACVRVNARAGPAGNSRSNSGGIFQPRLKSAGSAPPRRISPANCASGSMTPCGRIASPTCQ
jgi:asparagine synthase (glutamine-hydrolysing)